MAGRVLSVVTGCVIAAACFAAPASAGIPGPTFSLGSVGPYEYLKADFANVASQTGAPAECNSSDNVIGGGGSVSGKPTAGALNRSSPSTPVGDAWTAEGRALGGGTRTVATFAICSPTPNGFNNGTGPIEPGHVQTIVDSCAPGQEMFGIGIQGSGSDIRLLESSLTGTTGLTTIGQNVGGATGEFTEWYQCIDNYAAAVRLDQVSVPGHDSGKATARCKSGQAVIFGGFALNASGKPAKNSWVTSTRPFDSKDKGKTPEDGWTVKAQNNRNGKIVLSAEAVCAPIV